MILPDFQQFGEVLARDPKSVAATFGVASLNGPSRIRESRDVMLEVIAQDPKNVEAYYFIGVLDWQMVFGPIRKAKAAPQDNRIGDAAARKRLREEWTPHIEEGLRMLQIALRLNPARSDAMAYMNLLLRARAAISESPGEVAGLMARADEWVDKSIAARRKAQTQSSAQQISENEPPPLTVQAGPPPPPPPPPPKG